MIIQQYHRVNDRPRRVREYHSLNMSKSLGLLLMGMIFTALHSLPEMSIGLRRCPHAAAACLCCAWLCMHRAVVKERHGTHAGKVSDTRGGRHEQEPLTARVCYCYMNRTNNRYDLCSLSYLQRLLWTLSCTTGVLLYRQSRCSRDLSIQKGGTETGIHQGMGYPHAQWIATVEQFARHRPTNMPSDEIRFHLVSPPVWH